MNERLLLAAGFLLALPAACPADEVPLVGRPADLPFSGASAPFVVAPGPEYRVPFAVSASARPTRLEALTPLTLTVTVVALGRVLHPPQRIDLSEAPGFKEAFHIEDVADGQKQQPGPGRWRWVYRLKPRGPETRSVPGVPFVFYNPDLRPVEKAFQVVFTDPIPLAVLEPEPIVVTDLPPPLLSAAGAPEVLRRPAAWQTPAPAALAAVALVPPLACLCWYRLWRRRHPDAAQRARVRRSTAARRALRTLEGAGAGPGGGDRVAGAVAAYLRDRFGRGPAEWTPAEAMQVLLEQGFPLELVEQAAELFRACAAARFPPDPVEQGDLAVRARAFVLAVEEST